MDLKIRKATSVDVPILQKLNNEVFIDNHKYDSDLILDWATSEKGRAYFTKLLLDKKTICFIAEDDGKPVAYIAARPREFGYRKSRYFEVDNMGTIPTYRSKGLGSMLITKVRQWAKEQGYDRLFVNTYFFSSKAVKFYKENGFQEIDLDLFMQLI